MTGLSAGTTYQNIVRAKNGTTTGANSNMVSATTTSASANSANTVLLLHADGSNGSTVFVDSGSNGKTVTAYGNAQISTAQSKFGGASAYFDGNGDYLSVPSSDDWSFGTEAFTMEAWIRLDDTSTYKSLVGRAGNSCQ